MLRRLAVAVACAIAPVLVVAAPAAALPDCGSLGQPTCVEAPPPGVELKLSKHDNPRGLRPLSGAPSATKPLWPRVGGHKPYGFNAMSAGLDGTTIGDEVTLHAEMGASMARVGINWALVQYFPRDGIWGGRAWDYQQWVDPYYKAYVRRGIRPLLTIMHTPRRFTKNASTFAYWPATICGGTPVGTGDDCSNPPRPDALDAWRTFVRDVARRYPLAAGIEIWNEPNLTNPFWGGEAADPERYAQLLDVAHDAIKSVRPAMPVIGGALANMGVTDRDEFGFDRMAMRPFLARMLRAGAADNMDAISVHPYLGSYPEGVTQGEADQRLFGQIAADDAAIRGAYMDAGVPMQERVVITEFGASTTDGFTEERQAAWLRLQYWLWDVDHENVPLASRTDAAFAHRAVEQSTPYGTGRGHGFGFVRLKEDGRFATKPVFCAFRTEFGGFADCPQRVGSADG